MHGVHRDCGRAERMLDLETEYMSSMSHVGHVKT